MDNIDCLKKLTEDIVKKQNDSLESVKRLSQATDIISSDILNLINSLQMVGNKQFAENRIHDDDSLMAANGGTSGQATVINISTSLDSSDKTNINNATLDGAKEDKVYSHHHHHQHHIAGPENNDKGGLSLGSILLRAIELLPPTEEDVTPVVKSNGDDDEVEQEDTCDYDEHQEKLQLPRLRPGDSRVAFEVVEMTIEDIQNEYLENEIPPQTKMSAIADQTQDVASGSIEVSSNAGDCTGRSAASEPGDDHDKLGFVNVIKERVDSGSNNNSHIKSMDRHRVADILKKYSLYDDDEDDDDEEEDDDTN